MDQTKAPNLFVKLATVLSSVLLVAGCVSYRSGAFDSFVSPSAKSADSPNDSGVEVSWPAELASAPTESQQPPSAESLHIMSGSKSSIGLIPASAFEVHDASVKVSNTPAGQAAAPPEPPASKAMTIMPSTKSANPLGVIEGVIPAAQNTSAPQSSKPSDLFAK
jgi:hypothetical protein